MRLVNESGQQVAYWIQTGTDAECGNIPVDGYVDYPEFDNQVNVYVGFNTEGTDVPFSINCTNTGTGQQVEMALVVEAGG
jgi:hypothetical protein